MIKILLDADTGVDDSIALLYALKNPDVQLVGVTTVLGNTDPVQAAKNSLALIALAKPDYEVPVAIGAGQTLKGVVTKSDTHVHGKNGIGDAELPPAEQKPIERGGVDFMIEQARKYAGELVIVATGRLTNLALAIQKDASFVKNVKKAVIMGGTVFAPGNVSPVAEANIYGDPEAADLVLTSGMDVTIVGLDVTKKTILTYDDVLKLERHCREENQPIVRYLKDCLGFYMSFYTDTVNTLESCPMHDPLAMLVAVNPALVTTRKWKARVECTDGLCRGMIVTDRREHTFKAEFVEFCIEVDGDKAVAELLAAFL
ncbi:nucleoside hydrolase [Anaerolentibacter hominis]|uniref:nucleoside hydrolase n=1 Tax=Anaerolentibacter hominis TaxID=3079009 RepID=UPI0031B81DAA